MNQKEALKLAKKAIQNKPMPSSLKKQFELSDLGHLLDKVNQRTAELFQNHQSATKKQMMHLEQILPCIAFYEVLIEYTQNKEEALKLFEQWSFLKIEQMVKLIPIVMKVPGLYRVIPSMMNQMLDSMFSHASGFDYVRKECDNGFAVDMTACPYVKTCKKYGCPELAQFFCKSDDLCYGNMHPRLIWGRTKTLGMGEECCDFKMTIKEK